MNDQPIYGLHAVEALLNNPLRTTKQIIVNQDRQDKRMQAILAKVELASIPILQIPASKMDARFPDVVHQGIVAIANPLPQYHEQDLSQLLAQKNTPPFILILDGITDPHNLGACLRVADGAGIDCVIIPKDKSATITPAVSKVACGAAESVPLIRVTNLARTIESLKEQGIWVFGAAGEANQSIYDLDGNIPMAIILGAEGDGMRRLTKDRCDGLFSIPMLGSVSSLNVSVATGVCLYEVVRQRKHS